MSPTRCARTSPTHAGLFGNDALLELGEQVDLVAHRVAQLHQQPRDLVEVPVERRDRISGGEQPCGHAVPGGLVRGHGGRLMDPSGEGADDGAGQELGVAEGVGEAVRGDRVLEVAGVADQSPTGPVGACGGSRAWR